MIWRLLLGIEVRTLTSPTTRTRSYEMTYLPIPSVEKLRSILRKIPDLERTISRIHSNTCKVKEFVTALGAFEALLVSSHRGSSADSQGLELVDRICWNRRNRM